MRLCITNQLQKVIKLRFIYNGAKNSKIESELLLIDRFKQQYRFKLIHTGKNRSNLVVSQIQSFHKNKSHKRFWLQRFNATITQFQILNCVACQIECIRFDIGESAIHT